MNLLDWLNRESQLNEKNSWALSWKLLGAPGLLGARTLLDITHPFAATSLLRLFRLLRIGKLARAIRMVAMNSVWLDILSMMPRVKRAVRNCFCPWITDTHDFFVSHSFCDPRLQSLQILTRCLVSSTTMQLGLCWSSSPTNSTFMCQTLCSRRKFTCLWRVTRCLSSAKSCGTKAFLDLPSAHVLPMRCGPCSCHSCSRRTRGWEPRFECPNRCIQAQSWNLHQPAATAFQHVRYKHKHTKEHNACHVLIKASSISRNTNQIGEWIDWDLKCGRVFSTPCFSKCEPIRWHLRAGTMEPSPAPSYRCLKLGKPS